MALLSDVRSALITGAIGVADTSSNAEWPVVVSQLVDKEGQDQMIAVTPMPGKAPEGQWNVSYPEFFIWVRGAKNDYGTAEAKMHAAMALLHDSSAIVSAGIRRVSQEWSSPMNQYDTHQRPVLSMLFNVIDNT